MLKLALFVLLLPQILLNSNKCLAQASESEYIAATTSAGMRTWRLRVKPEFLAVADKDAKEIINSTKLSIPRAGNFNAFSSFENDTPRIIIPFGLLAINDYIVNNTLFSMHNPKCSKYLEKTILDLRREYIQYIKDGVPRKVRTVWDYCGMTQQESETFFRQTDIYNASVAMQVDAIAAIIGHELGHLILRHRRYSDISKLEAQKQEYAADDYGFDLSMRAGFNPAAALGATYLFFLALEGENAPTGTHPRASCRIIRLADSLLFDRYIKEGYWKKEFKEPPSKSDQTRLMASLKPLREDCSLP